MEDKDWPIVERGEIKKMFLLIQLLLQRSVKVNPAYLGIRPPENSRWVLGATLLLWMFWKGKRFKKLAPWYVFESKQIRLLKVQTLTDIVHTIPENVFTHGFENNQLWGKSIKITFEKYNFQVATNTKDHLPVDSAERVHSRTAESSSFTVITNTDLLATWI